jgi:hypothetical protein
MDALTTPTVFTEDLRRRMNHKHVDREVEGLRREMERMERETHERDLEEIQDSYQW